MAEPEKKFRRNRNNRWWIWAVVAIIGIIVFWIALDNRTDVHRTEDSRIPDSTVVRERTAPDFDDR